MTIYFLNFIIENQVILPNLIL